MTNAAAGDPAHPGLDLAGRLYAITGLGDIGVGALLLAYPPLLGWLIGQPLDAGGALAARLLGCAAMALGAGWWHARRRPDARRPLRPGMLLYNFGAGGVFLLAALLAASPAIPILVGLMHVALGVAAALLPSLRHGLGADGRRVANPGTAAAVDALIDQGDSKK